MFRSHGTDTPREVWRFGEPGEPVYEALSAALRLRYRLLPYIYSLAGWTTQQAYTMLRSLLFDFADDPAVHDVADQFMFGPAFLVCPVHEPMWHGPDSTPLADAPRTRRLYLPEGNDWHDFWTGQRFRGGRCIDVDAPLERIPVFVRSGSIVPMGPVRQHADDLPDAPLELHVYSGSDGIFRLYEDEGDGYGYEDGAFATIDIAWNDAAMRLTVGARMGKFPGMARERDLVLMLHAGADAAGHGPGTEGPATTARLRYAGEEVSMQW